MQAFASEVGQPPEKVNALQYLHEASAEAGSFLDSDCAYRVEGGTENMIIAMKKHLAEQGVKFTYNAPVEKIEKSGHGVKIHPSGLEPVHADKTILALPAYALAKIDGLEALGMSAAAKNLIANTQYTNSVKFTVKTKPGVVAPKDNFFSNHGFQVWSAGEGQMTFLVNADKLERMKAPEMIRAVMGSYATSLGTSAEAMFDTSPGNIVFTNPGKNACYASPAKDQARQLELLGGELEKMHAHGVGVVGTYLPHQTENGIELGFMECGMASAERVVGQMLPKQQHKTQWVEKVANKSPQHAHARNDNDAMPNPALVPHGHVQAVHDNRANNMAIGR